MTTHKRKPSPYRTRPRHLHDWQLVETRTLLDARAVQAVYRCKCREQRTEELKLRKPSATALTDSERAFRAASRQLHAVTPEMGGWPAGTPGPQGKEQP